MVRTRIVLEVESDQIEDAANLVESLRVYRPDQLALHQYKVGSVAHVVEPDAEEK